MAAKPNQVYKQLYKQYMSAGIDPAVVSGWGQQTAAAEQGYQDTRTLLRQERKTLRRQTRQQVRDVRTQGRWDMQAAAASANERGVLGSSTDVMARQQIRSSAKSGVAAAREAKVQGINNLLAQGVTAKRDYYSQLASIQMARAAAKSLGGIQNYAEGLLDPLVAPGGNVQHRDTELGIKQAVNQSDTFRELLANLERAGFRVGETGVPGYGGVTAGIHEGTGHLERPKRTADINWAPGESPEEKRKLQKLYDILIASGVPVSNILYPGNDDEHQDHLHLEVALRRWLEDQGNKKGA